LHTNALETGYDSQGNLMLFDGKNWFKTTTVYSNTFRNNIHP